MRIKLFVRDCSIIAVLPLIVACGEKYPGTSVAAEAGIFLNQGDSPQYIQAALVRAGQLSTSPEVLVAICDADAKALGYADKKLAKSVEQCVENSGMD